MLKNLIKQYGTHPQMSEVQNLIHLLYLNWLNSAQTVKDFANNHGLTFELALAIIREGKALNAFYNDTKA